MTVTPNQIMMSTSHGRIAVEDRGGRGVPIVMIHGNSTCRGVFLRQMQADDLRERRLISFDLPGHGQSDDAVDPHRSYTRLGLADLAAELLGALGIRELVLLGWSLGGHVAIELLPRLSQLKGVIITGTPPISHAAPSDGFVAPPQHGLPAVGRFSDAEARRFAEMAFGSPVPPFVLGAIKRTDRRFRERLFAAMRAGEGVDQRATVLNSAVPLALINGADDPLIRLDYLDSLDYPNLWEGRCHRLERAGHAPFWHAAGAFNRLLARFMADIER